MQIWCTQTGPPYYNAVKHTTGPIDQATCCVFLLSTFVYHAETMTCSIHARLFIMESFSVCFSILPWFLFFSRPLCSLYLLQTQGGSYTLWRSVEQWRQASLSFSFHSLLIFLSPSFCCSVIKTNRFSIALGDLHKNNKEPVTLNNSKHMQLLILLFDSHVKIGDIQKMQTWMIFTVLSKNIHPKQEFIFYIFPITLKKILFRVVFLSL